MSSSFGHHVRKLKALSTRFDATSNDRKLATIQRLAECELRASRSLIAYCDLLQFIQAFPPNGRLLKAAKSELSRVARFMALPGNASSKLLENSGLPYTPYVTKFSHDCISWLLDDGGCRIAIDRYEDAEFDLNKVLAITLPSLERHETTAGEDNAELLRSLVGGRAHELRFLVAEVKKLNDSPLVKDLLFDALGLHLRLTPKNKAFSRTFNSLPKPGPFFHDGVLKEFDQQELLDRRLPGATKLAGSDLDRAIRIVRLSMVLNARETDPVTYMDERTFRFFELERGLSIAVFGMVPARQLPLESYIGYTLFKNGIPAAYGGAWVFGSRADLGINIFEAFRGGESGYVLCQVLRVFRQVFKVGYFEIEPYQFGLDNPDGIATGAFWFYHKHGFRPIDKQLLALSEAEMAKRKARKAYRTSNRVLKRFTASNMALELEHHEQPGVYDITAVVKDLILTRYKGDRALAVVDCRKNFMTRTGMRKVPGPDGIRVLEEVALWAEATRVNDPGRLDPMALMIRVKPVDPYRYQQLLLRFFEGK